MIKRDAKNFILMGLIILYIGVYKLFLFQNFMKYSELINASFLVLLTGLAIHFLGFRKDKSKFDTKQIFKITIFFVLVTLLVTYGLGFLVGFLRNAYSRDFLTLIDNIFAPIVIIAATEIFRYTVIWANKDKKRYTFLFTAVLIILEIAIRIRTLSLSNAEALFRTTATIILPVIAKNCVLSFLCYHVGYKIPLVYRLIMDVYGFIVPVVPNIGEYLNSIILIALPIVIYIQCCTYLDERRGEDTYLFEENKFSFWDIPIAVFVIVLAALVSGFFPHYMIGIGSQSMSPTINKGDAVIIKKVSKKDTLKKGDIIAYAKEDKVVVHRIYEVTKNGGSVTYTTKGDANNGVDSVMVDQSQVRGIIKLRIPYIAFPSVYLQEFFSR